MAAQTIAPEQVIPPDQPWSSIIKQGQRLRIVDIEGNQGVDVLCYSAANPNERYRAANTLKVLPRLSCKLAFPRKADRDSPFGAEIVRRDGISKPRDERQDHHHSTWGCPGVALPSRRLPSPCAHAALC